MLSSIFVSFVLVCGASAQVLMTVFPPFVEPGLTPFFTLRCDLAEFEEGQIISISIFRRPVTSRNILARELVAELRGAAPGLPIVSPALANVTAVGQISMFEMAELGTFLQVTWPEPGVDALGVYTCNVNVLGLMGPQVLFAEAIVSSSSPATDRLLAAVYALERDVGLLSRSMTGVQPNIPITTTGIQQPNANQVAGATAQGTAASGGPVSETPAVSVPAQDTPTQAPATPATAHADLKRLVDALEYLEIKFEQFNQTLERLDKIITTLEEKAEAEAEVVDSSVNKTWTEPAIDDVVLNYFLWGNNSYFLFHTNLNATADRAQTVCESKRLSLAEISNTGEFKVIAGEISPYIEDGGLVIIGGQKALGEDTWIYPRHQEPVHFSVWGSEQQEKSTDNECLALQKSTKDFVHVPVSCSSDLGNLFFLCAKD